MYEGRIERRLQKAMTEFHKWRLMRQMEEQEEAMPKAQDTSCKTKPNSGGGFDSGARPSNQGVLSLGGVR
jgi:hypothetical protein